LYVITDACTSTLDPEKPPQIGGDLLRFVVQLGPGKPGDAIAVNLKVRARARSSQNAIRVP
jgi:hypothetical protein